MKKSIVIIVLILGLSAIWFIYRMYNKPHRDPLSETSIQISASDLYLNYESNETEANELYLDKVVEIKGRIAEITTNQELVPIVVLETDNPIFGVRCTMENPMVNAQVGDTVTIKGICTGYLSDVIITKSVFIE